MSTDVLKKLKGQSPALTLSQPDLLAFLSFFVSVYKVCNNILNHRFKSDGAVLLLWPLLPILLSSMTFQSCNLIIDKYLDF